jgi:hypothetical protein
MIGRDLPSSASGAISPAPRAEVVLRRTANLSVEWLPPNQRDWLPFGPVATSRNLSSQISWPRECPCGDEIQSQKPPAAMMMIRPSKPACVQISTFNRPITLVTPQKAEAGMGYSLPVGILPPDGEGSAPGSGLGRRSRPGQSPNELRFSLSHFPHRRTSSKPTGP